MQMHPIAAETDPDFDRSNKQGNCDICGHIIFRFRGDAGPLICPTPDCPAIYSISGQRYRDDLLTRRNPSEYDDDIDDLTGDELSYAHDAYDVPTVGGYDPTW